ncbi:acyltransferase [Agrobacterium sp. AGB01]|nr:acyltransferase [Agrobacterium sp. AGB01]
MFSHCIRAYTIYQPQYMQDLSHSWLSGSWLREGMAVGVDIFFVISGFIMVHVSKDHAEGRKTPGNFIWLRLKRIYPPYIVATLVLMGLVIAWSHSIPDDFNVWRIVLSVALIQSFNPNGLVQPILGTGWTLSYEMYFYLAFAAALAIGKRSYLAVLVVMITGGWLVSSAIYSYSALGVFFSNPIVFEFLFGCAIGYLYAVNKIPRVSSFIAALAVLFICVVSHLNRSELISDNWRFLYLGIPAAVIVTSALSWRVSGRVSNFFSFLGDASYSIYLIHIVVIYQVMSRVYPKLISFGFVTSIDQAVAITFIVATIGGILFHLVVERQFNEWRKRTKKRAAERLVGA